MLKYLQEIVISAIISIILFVVTTYFTGSILAGVTVLTAVFVIINFYLNRYETRNEAKVELKIVEEEDTHFFSVSIINTGGKIIYLDRWGVKTKEGIIVDFDEETKVRIVTKKEQNKPRFGIPFFDNLKYNLNSPTIISRQSSVNPGDAASIRKKVWEILYLLIDKKIQSREILELKGFFTDRLNYEYESKWIQFSSKTLLEMTQEDLKKIDTNNDQ